MGGVSSGQYEGGNSGGYDGGIFQVHMGFREQAVNALRHSAILMGYGDDIRSAVDELIRIGQQVVYACRDGGDGNVAVPNGDQMRVSVLSSYFPGLQMAKENSHHYQVLSDGRELPRSLTLDSLTPLSVRD